MKVLVTKSPDFKALIGTWQEVELDYIEVDGQWQEVYVVLHTEKPVYLNRWEFQKEEEVAAKDFVLNHYRVNGTFPKIVTYGKKELKYLLSNRIITNQDGLINVEYTWANHTMSFAVVNSIAIAEDGSLYLRLHDVRYSGISSYEYPEPKEYYVE